MQPKVQRHSSAARARHGKRLPQDPDPYYNEPNIIGPVTITINQIIPSITPTVLVPPELTPSVTFPAIGSTPHHSVPTTTTSTSTTTSSSSSVAPSSSSQSSSQIPSPSASAKGGKTDTSTDTSSSPIPIGVILGIVIVAFLVILPIIAFVLRRRSVRNRLKLRAWATKKGTSFWIDSKEKPADPLMNPPPKEEPRYTFSSDLFVRVKPQQAAGSVSQKQQPQLSSTSTTPSPLRPSPALGTEPSYNYSAIPVSSPASAGASKPGTPWAASPQSAKVKSIFIPTLPDELSISTGEVIRIQVEFDDGWALCSNVRGETGMVPLECLDRGFLWQVEEARRLARGSSLGATMGP